MSKKKTKRKQTVRGKVRRHGKVQPKPQPQFETNAAGQATGTESSAEVASGEANPN